MHVSFKAQFDILADIYYDMGKSISDIEYHHRFLIFKIIDFMEFRNNDVLDTWERVAGHDRKKTRPKENDELTFPPEVIAEAGLAR